MNEMKIGYIRENDNKFELLESEYTRRITSKSDKISTKILSIKYDYDDVQLNTNIIREDNHLILVQEPFFLDEEIRTIVTRWIDWANSVERSRYDSSVCGRIRIGD